MVVCDNVGLFAHEYSEYTDFVRNPANGFRSILMPYQGGLEVPYACRDRANEAHRSVCIFDKTARGEATLDALRLLQRMGAQ